MSFIVTDTLGNDASFQSNKLGIAKAFPLNLTVQNTTKTALMDEAHNIDTPQMLDAAAYAQMGQKNRSWDVGYLRIVSKDAERRSSRRPKFTFLSSIAEARFSGLRDIAGRSGSIRSIVS